MTTNLTMEVAAEFAHAIANRADDVTFAIFGLTFGYYVLVASSALVQETLRRNFYKLKGGWILIVFALVGNIAWGAAVRTLYDQEDKVLREAALSIGGMDVDDVCHADEDRKKIAIPFTSIVKERGKACIVHAAFVQFRVRVIAIAVNFFMFAFFTLLYVYVISSKQISGDDTTRS